MLLLRLQNARREQHEPKSTVPPREREEPSRAQERTEMEEPICAKFNAERLEPNLANVLKENELARVTKSNKLRSPRKRQFVSIERLDPKRVKERILKVLPMES
jgi:hypothetical protein